MRPVKRMRCKRRIADARPTGHPKLIGAQKRRSETIRVNVAARGAAHRGERVPRIDAAPDPGRQSRPVTAGRKAGLDEGQRAAEGEGRPILGTGSGRVV